MKVDKKIYQKIAIERINFLFKLSRINSKLNPKRSKRYLKLAQDISMKSNVSIPSELKRQFCKKCMNYFIFGKTAQVRLDSDKKTRIITCKNCGEKYRISYSKQKST